MIKQTKATRKGGAKTGAQRQDEKRKRDLSETGFNQLNIRCHVDDSQKVKDFVKGLNSARVS